MTARVGGADGHPIAPQDELMSLTLRMIGEYPGIPAGSVMRCVSRAVRRVLMSGTPRDEVPARVERLARRTLARRGVSEGEHAHAEPAVAPGGPVRSRRTG